MGPILGGAGAPAGRHPALGARWARRSSSSPSCSCPAIRSTRWLPLIAYEALIEGAIGSPDAIVSTLVNTTPLVFGGLAVGFAFKAGLFNIGVQGQFLMGALGAVIVGVWVADLPPIVAIPLATLAGIAAGAAWGFIPGFLKAVSGAHEVVSTIMLNYIAVAILAAAVSGPLKVPKSPSPVTYDVGNAAFPIIIPPIGHLGIPLAVLAAFFVYWLLLPHDVGLPGAGRGREQRRRPVRGHAAAAGHGRHDVVQRRAGRDGRGVRAAGRHPLDDLELRDDGRLRLDRRRAAGPVEPADDAPVRAAVRLRCARAPA